MRRIYKVIGGMLIAGVLIAGIGSGVAFAEYSSFEYGGEVVLAGSERFTKTLNYKVPEGTEVLDITTDHHTVVEEDTSVPKDKVVIKILYLTDDKDVTPEIIQTPDRDLEESYDAMEGELEEPYDSKDTASETVQNKSGNSDKTYESIYVNCDYQYNDFRDIMRAKDLILSDLKNHKVSDYHLDQVEKIEIHINPEADFTLDRVHGY